MPAGGKQTGAVGGFRYDNIMRLFPALGVILLSTLVYAADRPPLLGVKSVYLLPMGSSLDQYLAEQLAVAGHYTIVTDPNKADAVFTDKVGESFEMKMAELYPPPATEKDEEADKQEDAWGKPPQHFGGFSRARGTVFLVDRATRNVIWSFYEPATTSRPEDMQRRAKHISDKLSKHLKELSKKEAKEAAAPVVGEPPPPAGVPAPPLQSAPAETPKS